MFSSQDMCKAESGRFPHHYQVIDLLSVRSHALNELNWKCKPVVIHNRWMRGLCHETEYVYFARSPENFWGFLFECTLEFCIGKLRDFFVICFFFFYLRFPQTKARQLLKNLGTIRRKIQANNSKNSGKFRSATFLTLKMLVTKLGNGRNTVREYRFGTSEERTH